MSYTVKKSSDRPLREISQFGVRSSNIAPKAVESEHIGEQAVQTQHVQDKAITGVKIAEASIDEAHIKDAAITTAKIQDAAITSAKIGDLSADKIKAGVLTVTDQVGAGASGIIVKSGTAERVRLDKNGITVNEGNIIVRSPTGATMISAQGINVNEFTENVMRGFNIVRNPFWIDRRREYKTRWIQTYSDKNHFFSGSPASRALHQIIPATVDGKEYIYVFYTKYTAIADQPAVCRYYPPTATWETMSKIPNDNFNRSWFSIQKSSDNKVYLFGGNKGSVIITNECWEYDLDTDSWQQKAPMSKGLTQIVSLLVGNKIYVFGGLDSTDTWNRYCYIYDITTNSWIQGWQIPYEDHYSVAYYGSYIYVFCLLAKRILKYTTSGSLVSNEAYDKDVPTYNANCVYGSKIYFVGGIKELVDRYVTDHADSCISYDFDTKTFEDLASLPFKIHYTSVCVVTKLGSNTSYGVSEFPRLYMIGGYTRPETQTVPGIESTEVYMLPLYSGETDSEGYYFDDWSISKDDSSLQVVWKPAGTKGNGRITFANPNKLDDKRVILSQFVDLSKIDTSSPYTLSSYGKTWVAHQHLSSRIGDKSYVDSIYSLLGEESFIERTFENLPNEGEYLLELCIQMFKEDQLSWFYGVQLEKGKVSSGIVAPHLEDLGLPLGSIRPEHLYESAIPPGAIMPFARPTAPAGWLICDGRAVNRTQYKNLFNAIGTTFGAGDGSTTFNLPDLRGEFIRGWDNGRGVDPGRQFGSWQADEFRQHNHYSDIRFNKLSARASDIDGAGTTTATDSGGGTYEYRIGQMSNYWDAATLKDTGGSETRPRNVALLYCIKY